MVVRSGMVLRVESRRVVAYVGHTFKIMFECILIVGATRGRREDRVKLWLATWTIAAIESDTL